MNKFKYTGKCKAGKVVFRRHQEVVEMPHGESVEVPEWLAEKLDNNPEFERVGRKRKNDGD